MHTHRTIPLKHVHHLLVHEILHVLQGVSQERRSMLRKVHLYFPNVHQVACTQTVPVLISVWHSYLSQLLKQE